MTSALRVAAGAATVAFALALIPGAVRVGGQSLTAVDEKSNRPTPRTADGHPDLSGYWKGTRDTRPVGNIGKDLPGFKLPLTPAGEAALQHNLTATIDPESLCIIGGIPRHNASGLPLRSCKVAGRWRSSTGSQLPPDPNRRAANTLGRS